MIKVDVNTKQKAVEIVYRAFQHVDAVTSIVKNDAKKEDRVEVLFNFCIDMAMAKDGAFFTSDMRGVALLYKSWMRPGFHRAILNYTHLLHYGIGWNRAPKMLARELQIQKRRMKSKHLYFWLLGFDNEVKDMQRMMEIRDFCFEYSKSLQLPIAAETTSERALGMYTRYGFDIYDTWKPSADQPTLYFISRDWRK